MFGVAKLPRARRDLIEIWHYTAEHWGEEQADRYVRLIDHAIQRLRDNPSIGSDCGHVRPGLRRYPAERHRIYYRLAGMLIEIVRILHVSMDVEDRFPENEN
jgi:toxin ParE1/3/4